MAVTQLGRAILFQYPTAIPIEDFVALNSGGVQQIVKWNTAKLGAQPTPTQLEAIEASAEFIAYWQPSAIAARAELAAATAAKATYDADTEPAKIARAIVLTLIDELNILRQWIGSFKAEVAASTSLANLQTRVAALPTLTDRTAAQARTALRAKVDAD